MHVITLPGLIDPHVHLREPGQTQKEDFTTGTSAALSGGFTAIMDMPNNPIPVTTKTILVGKKELARQKILCDVGFYFGSLGNNLEEFTKVTGLVYGLKLYLNETTGNFLLDSTHLLSVFSAWPAENGPILLHAEQHSIDEVIAIAEKTKKRIHICHVSRKEELIPILEAKRRGLQVTCGVTPHHLFLTQENLSNLGSFGLMKPSLGTIEDQEFLWENLVHIDMIESDHAPHTKEEKTGNDNCFGVPGLETTLPLLLTAVKEKRLTIDDVVRLCHIGPKILLRIPTDEDTTVTVDLDEAYILTGETMQTKCKWTPFEGRQVYGKVKKVTLHGKEVYKNGSITAEPGTGHIL